MLKDEFEQEGKGEDNPVPGKKEVTYAEDNDIVNVLYQIALSSLQPTWARQGLLQHPQPEKKEKWFQNQSDIFCIPPG